MMYKAHIMSKAGSVAAVYRDNAAKQTLHFP